MTNKQEAARDASPHRLFFNGPIRGVYSVMCSCGWKKGSTKWATIARMANEHAPERLPPPPADLLS